MNGYGIGMGTFFSNEKSVQCYHVGRYQVNEQKYEIHGPKRPISFDIYY